MWDECNCVVVWAFFGIAFLWDWYENWPFPIWSHGPQPCTTEWNYKPCHVGPPKMDELCWRVLTKRDPLENGMANHFGILALRTPWTVWKGKKIGHWKIHCPVGAQYATGGQWRNNFRKNEESEPKQKHTQLWIWLVMEVKSDAVKCNIA